MSFWVKSQINLCDDCENCTRRKARDKTSSVGGWDIKLPANEPGKSWKKRHTNVSIRIGFLFNDNLLFLPAELMIKVWFRAVWWSRNWRHLLCFQLSTNSNDQLKVTSHLYARSFVGLLELCGFPFRESVEFAGDFEWILVGWDIRTCFKIDISLLQS
jgi:hypothetical protein